jgi:hypothetical protein
MIDAIDSEKFEHCLPDMKTVIEMKTWDIDGFLIGMRALKRPAGGAVKALLSGASPDKSEVRHTPRTSWKRFPPRSPSACTTSTTPGSSPPTGW